MCTVTCRKGGIPAKNRGGHYAATQGPMSHKVASKPSHHVRVVRLLLILLMIVSIVGPVSAGVQVGNQYFTDDEWACIMAINKMNDCERACWMQVKDVTDIKDCVKEIGRCKDQCAGRSSSTSINPPPTTTPITTKITTVPVTTRVVMPPTTVPTTLIIGPLNANIYATETSGPAPLRVDFSDTSTGAVASRLWTFGDGYKSEVANPGHTYREPGTYRVQLTIYDGLGQSDSATETIVVEPAEGVTPGPSPSGPGITTTPTIQSTPGPGTETPSSPITPGDAVSGMEAGIAGVLGGAIALGATAGLGWLPGGGTPPGSARDLEDEYRRLLDTIATEKANRDAWTQSGRDSGRDGMIALLEEEAERRRQELESMGIVPDYEGTSDSLVGPSSTEQGLLGVEKTVGEIESDTMGIMDQDRRVQAGIDNLFRLRHENGDATTDYQYWKDVAWDDFEKTVRQLATGRDYDGKVTRASWWLGLGGRVGIDIMTGGQAEYAFFPTQLTDNALEYVEKDPNATELGMYGKMVGETWMYALTMKGMGVASETLGQTVQANAPLLRDMFPKTARVCDVLTTDVKDLIPGATRSGELPPQSGLPKAFSDEAVAAGDAAYRDAAGSLIREAKDLKLSGNEDVSKVMELASRIRKNDLAVKTVNENPDLAYIAETNAEVEKQAMGGFGRRMAEKTGTDPNNIIMKKWTGRTSDKLGKDFDGTAYEYVPEGNELPPHLTPDPANPEVALGRNEEFISQMKPEGKLIGNGKYYKDFSTGEVREVVPGKYYEPAMKVSDQQEIFNESLHEAAGSPPDVTPGKLADDLNVKVTTRMSTDSYGYNPEQTGQAIGWKIQEPSSVPGQQPASAYANSHHEAIKLIDKLDKKIADAGMDPVDVPKNIPQYGKIQEIKEIIKANEGCPLATENALRDAGVSTSDIGNIVGNAYYWLGKL